MSVPQLPSPELIDHSRALHSTARLVRRLDEPHQPVSDAIQLKDWRWSQTWRDLFFAHWQVPAHQLSQLIPKALDVDTWNGAAWVSIVAFRLDVQHRWLPSFGVASNFVEVNLRTYVRCRGERGILFLSIHAGSRIAVSLARMLTPLPYVHAPMAYHRDRDKGRLTCGGATALVAAEFRTNGTPAPLVDDSLDAWLLERYHAFVPDRLRRITRMTAAHPAWLAQPCDAHISSNNLGRPFGLDLCRPPAICHFASRMKATLGPFA